MAYEKQSWSCGDTITADKLNHIEDGIANADCGYSCEETSILLTDETVETTHPEGAPEGIYEGTLTYSQDITVDPIAITFDGAKYECYASENGEYGALYNVDSQTFDWSNYPFYIFVRNRLLPSGTEYGIVTESVGTHRVKIEEFQQSVETSECFKKAVKSVSGGNEPLKVALNNNALNKTWQQIADAYPNVYVEYSDIVGGLTTNHRYSVTDVSEELGKIDITYCVTFGDHTFTTTNPNQYPTIR